MRPTFRAVVLFGAGIPLSLILVLIDDGLWPIALAYLGLAIFAAGLDAVLALPARVLAVDIKLPEILYIGDRDTLQVEIWMPAGRPATSVDLVCDVGPTLAAPALQSEMIAPDRPNRIAVPLTALRRGAADIKRLWLRWRGPLSLMRKTQVYRIDKAVPVVPNIRAVRDAAIRFAAWDAPFGIKAQNQQGDGSEFDALREYLPGLDHRSIDWKHSARHRTLVCKEFRTERNHQIILAFDTGQLMSEPLGGIPRLDHAINAGLLLGYVSLRDGDRVGVFGFDSRVRLAADPVGGVHSFARLQRLSSDLEYRHEETNFTLGLADLLSRLKRRSLVILQTEFVDTITAELMVENLERLAQRHLVIFVTLQDRSLHGVVDAPPRTLDAMSRAVIADDLLHDRLVVFERLRRLGVHCLDVPSRTIGTDLLNRYIRIKRQELI